MTKKKNNRSGSNREELTNKILGIFRNSPNKTFNYKQMSKVLNLNKPEEKKQVNQVMEELAGSGFLSEVYTGKFKLKSRGGNITGKVDMNANGSAFISTEELTEKIYISERNLNHALQGDTVKVYLYAKRRSRRLEGEVLEVLERARNTFVGTVEISRNFAFLVTNSRSMPYDLFIPLEQLKGAKNGEKAIARITEWPRNMKNPTGEIIEVLGKPGVNEVEMHAILAEFDLPYRFPEEVEAEAGAIPEKIQQEEISRRRDFRKVPTFTIDPADAKDFDDALSLRRLKNGRWEVGVHIADVTHYVRPKSQLEEEARERATSVYLVDRVVPMLPEKLSNGVCSLRPNEEKLCFSAVFELDGEGQVHQEWFGKTVIYSRRRFSYEEAQQVIETGKGDMQQEILTLHDLAQKLRKKRFESGAFNFDRVEVKFELDEKGNPLRVYFKENRESNQLIEEFMLLANKKVAEKIGKTGKGKKAKTFVYRIHDKPNQEKLEKLSQLVSRFGHRLKTTGSGISGSMNHLLHEIRGKKEQDLIETLAIRAMAKAKYSTENIGHYGLAFPYYTHFTSPIRRYPDMMVHRLLYAYLEGESSRNRDKYESFCQHSSEMEQRASDAEFASVKYKQVEFMQDKLGVIFEGIISGVAEWGLYVEIVENKCEGLVPIRELDDDFYEYDEDHYCLRGRRNKKCYQLGDPIRVEVYRTNLLKRQLDFRLADWAE